ncbi:MAG: hypothetical protein O3A47_11120, partial [Chloroflexi bacterium]|nr:hypothetical protein [Chloroflexota bacterium]
GFSYSRSEIEAEPSDATEDAVVFEGEAGVKYFVSDGLAVSAQYVMSWANEDIFFDDAIAEDTDARLEIGMRFYF